MANRRQLYKYKGDRCTHCGLSVQQMVDRFGTFHRMFEFNHVDPNQKHPDYDNLIQRVLSSEQLDEVDKCILLCRECHGIVHAQDINAEMFVTVRVARKKAEQRLKGQMIIDNLARRGTFLTNERVLVWPYRVMLGAKKPRILFGTQLENEQLLNVYLLKLPQIGTVTIRSWKDNTQLMRAEYLGENRLKIEYEIRFPLITCELGGDNDGPVEVWVRNGIALTKDGQVIRNGTVTIEATLPEAMGPPEILDQS